MNKEDNILDLAINKLVITTKLPIHIERQNLEYKKEMGIDKIIRMDIQGIKMLYCCEVKNTVTKTMIGYFKIRAGELPHQQIIITRYLNPIMAELLKEEKIQFIDTAGNAYIDNFPLFIYTKGNRPEEKNREQTQKRIFTPKGLKIVFAVLCDKDLINKPYRDIAKRADVALGTVGWIMKDLREMGFLITIGNNKKKLMNQEAFLNRWCTEYVDKLKPKLFLGRFKGINDWENKQDINDEFAQWGGEVAAAKITNYLKPEILTIYTETEYLNYLIENNKIRKDINGNIEIFKRFWNTDNDDINNIFEHEHKDVVNPILIYADLLATGNQRNIETAKKIYEENLKYFKEN